MVKKLISALVLCFGFIGLSVAGVGKVAVSYGQSEAVSEEWELRSLKRGDDVFDRDTLRTGDDGMMKVRFKDGSIFTLEKNTVFQIAEYSYSGKESKTNRSVMQLLKGTLRSVSGAIGKENPEEFRLQTVVASVGIRGTEYKLNYCDSCCAADAQREEGLVGGIGDGKVAISRDGETVEVPKGSYFQVLKNRPGIEILECPPAGAFPGEDADCGIKQPVVADACASGISGTEGAQVGFSLDYQPDCPAWWEGK